MMLDAQADPGRRAWLPCPYCDKDSKNDKDSKGEKGRLYLLHSEANLVWVQCGRCLRRWWHDTGCGRGGGPSRLFDSQLFDVA